MRRQTATIRNCAGPTVDREQGRRKKKRGRVKGGRRRRKRRERNGGRRYGNQEREKEGEGE
jgi:hypothetical protein